MISGIGTDMIEVHRVREKIERHEGFLRMVFAEDEIQYCERMTHKFEHYAARFAAKEAFFKALGTGWTNGTAFHEVCILHDQNGKPTLHLLGETARLYFRHSIKTIHVSISHLREIASATVLIEQ